MIKERIVVDTDIFIDLLRGYEEAREYFRNIEDNQFDAYVSVITESELFSGETSNQLIESAKIESLLKLFKVIDVNRAIAKKAGQFRRIYRISMADALIAATAHHTNAKKIVTRNVKHYSGIKEVKALKPY